MPIRDLLRNDHSFEPDEIALIVIAFEDTLRELKLVRREDAATLLVAKTIFEAAKHGERDPRNLRECAVKQFLKSNFEMPNPRLRGVGLTRRFEVDASMQSTFTFLEIDLENDRLVISRSIDLIRKSQEANSRVQERIHRSLGLIERSRVDLLHMEPK